MEIGQRRQLVQAGLRSSARAIDRGNHDRSEESQGGLGRNGRVVDAQQRVDRRRRLQIGGRRRELDQSRAQHVRTHRQDSHRPYRNQHGVRLRAGKTVERQRRPRRLQNHRRRQDVEQGVEGRQPVDRLLDDVDGSGAPQDALCRHVGFPAPRLDVPLRRRQRDGAERLGVVQEHGRWGNVDGTVIDECVRIAAQAVGTRRCRGRALEAGRRLRVHRGDAAAERAVSLGQRRQDVADARSQPEHDLAAVLLRELDRRSA